MKKLYVGLLAIILCGTIPVLLVAGEIEKIRGDANGLRGLLVGIYRSQRILTEGMDLEKFLKDFEASIKKVKDGEESELVGQYLLFVPGLVEISEEFGERIKQKAYRFYSKFERDLENDNDIYRYGNVIEVLQRWNYQKTQEESGGDIDRHGNVIKALQIRDEWNKKTQDKIGLILKEVSEVEASWMKKEAAIEEENRLYEQFMNPKSLRTEAIIKVLTSCNTSMKEAFVMSKYVMSQSPKNLLEAFKYIEEFKPDYNVQKVIFPLFGSIFGVKRGVVDSELTKLIDAKNSDTLKNFKENRSKFLQNIDLIEREKSFLDKISKKTALAVLGLVILICCYRFELWRVFKSNFLNFVGG